MPDHYYTPLPASQHALRQFTANLFHREFSFLTDAGVFSRDGVDPGTRALIEAIPPLRGRALDLGCGWGAAGIPLAKINPECAFVLTDVNQRAAELARKNAALNGVEVTVAVGDGFESVSGDFDVIFSNPPIRAGKEKIYGLFAQAHERLAPEGVLYIVIRKQQGAPSALKYLSGLFARAEVIDRSGGYWVIAARKGA